MWAWLASFLGGPVITGLINAYKAKLAADNTSDKIAADLAARELAVQQVEIQATNQLRIAEVGHWFEPDKIMVYITAVYYGKLLIWDKVFALGSTDPLSGWAATTASLIVASYFGKRTVENAIRIWKRK